MIPTVGISLTLQKINMPDPNSGFSGMHLIATFISTIATGLIAGYAGIRFGMSKLRNERAFDKQLEWYEDLGKTIHILLNRYTSFRAYLLRGSFPLDVESMVKDLGNLSFRFQELAAMADMYAPSDTYRVVSDGVAEMNRLGAIIMPSSLNPSPEAHQAGEAAMAESIDTLRIIGGYVARDMRVHLGLDTLPVHKHLPVSTHS